MTLLSSSFSSLSIFLSLSLPVCKMKPTLAGSLTFSLLTCTFNKLYFFITPHKMPYVSATQSEAYRPQLARYKVQFVPPEVASRKKQKIIFKNIMFKWFYLFSLGLNYVYICRIPFVSIMAAWQVKGQFVQEVNQLGVPVPFFF